MQYSKINKTYKKYKIIIEKQKLNDFFQYIVLKFKKCLYVYLIWLCFQTK